MKKAWVFSYRCPTLCLKTGQMPRLIRVFAGRTVTLLVLSCHGYHNSYRYHNIYAVNKKDADQTVRMRRLNCAFVVRIWHEQIFYDVAQIRAISRAKGPMSHAFKMHVHSHPVGQMSNSLSEAPCTSIYCVRKQRRLWQDSADALTC